MIACGRYIAYDFFNCGKPLPPFLNALQECAASDKGAVNIGDEETTVAGLAGGI